ncbi:alpha/beta hydrolase [Roseofilum sp. BLCC_M91]|uniref:Alpha/beta hydrolase n=2 Tax=Roseofilum TaxID=1233426 RepID=A0ABT7BIU4_9CYAN|nr:alpha/beta hydrolase [Roseofilum halophilum BLCC-M91]
MALLHQGLWIFLAGLAIAYGSLCWYYWAIQTRLIFFPVEEITRTPADFNLDYEDVWVESVEPGVKLHGWWIPNSASNRVLLYLHGNADNIGTNAYHAGRFYHLGFSVFLFDYRGYGQSQGEFPTEKQVYDDTDTIWDYLVNERGIAPEQIVVYGHSLGGAIGIELATKHPQISHFIIEGSFTSLRRMGDYRYPLLNILPIDLLLQNQFNSLAKVPQLKMPTLFIHGQQDTAVPSFMSEELFAAAPEPKKLWLFPPGDHSTVAPLAGEEYFKTIREFVEMPPFPIPGYYLSPSK